LRCSYCDTEYAFHGGDWHSVAEMLEFARQSGARHVCVTGGEPLAQRNCLELLRVLCDADFSVSLETSGALDIDGVDPRVARVVDVKTPGSGESERNLHKNLDLLTKRDQVKFVLCSRADYEWARELIRSRIWPCQVLLSPACGQVEPRDLAEWMLADRLPARLQVQLHKYLWGGEAGR
jgi:7-carboxy-7-deazaguanine synthase